MFKAVRGYRRSRTGPGDEEAPEEEVDIDDDPDLASPPPPGRGGAAPGGEPCGPGGGAAAAGRARIKAVLGTLAAPPAPPRTQPFAAPYAGDEPPPYGFAWKARRRLQPAAPPLQPRAAARAGSPLGGAFWWSVDALDRRAPGAVEWALWAMGQASLTLHVLTVGVNLGVIWIMWDNGHAASPLIIVACYAAVTMFKELDMREAGDTYFSDVLALGTRVMFKGYEEARVALVTLLFALPAVVVGAVEYAVFMRGRLKTDVRDLHLLTSYHDQLYAAVCLCAINSVEKILRFSVVDPWMHERGDGFPLLYVRSHAARLPGSLVRDWLVRVKVALSASGGRLVLKARARAPRRGAGGGARRHSAHAGAQLGGRRSVRRGSGLAPARWRSCALDARAPRKPSRRATTAAAQELFAHYSSQLKDTSVGLADPHRAYLLRKAVHAFNTRHALDPAVAAGKPCLQIQARARSCAARARELDAEGIVPGAQLSAMLPDIFADAGGLSSLSLANNGLDDGALRGVVAALAGGGEALGLAHLDLGGNNMLPPGAAALAAMLASDRSLASLRLAGCPIGPEGAIALADALKVNPVLSSLSLAGTHVGTLGCEALCKALKGAASSGLKELDLSRTAIDDRGAAALAGLLSASRVLERLSLRGTRVTDAGAQLLCNALQGNATLQAIDVGGCEGMDRSWQKLLNHVVKGKARA
ncbi:NLRC3 [Scenedesmus sp. PABB004]|nr:NLRC3 [Scenedesmus sp. PABB004]